ncbi:putative membrane protein YdjX (TVP38/TMEM64 family) [Pseudorhizobium tarimense]|uniref:Membrane protein YdjX (TVP38/TMEM64 family) n=1 Tax=Pseudorhizobium tarimense TaxID=1079109 RepID=A0ABV2H742_9HYPH|nr:hypothetical protein [Pseudorhizobium tarimense]MCJ8519330.1 hypothetical protein [Pseudorhizobium tarimense]
MFIDDQKRARRLGLPRSAFPLALLALVSCGVMLLALIGRPDVPTVTASPFPSATTLHVAGLFFDHRVVFFLLVGGFLFMAGGCFILSRRSFRDALKAQSRRTD